MLRPALVCALLALAIEPLHADLIERCFPGKTEADVVQAFEPGLPAFLAARLKEVEKPRIRIEQARRKLNLELVQIKEDGLEFAELVRYGWYKDKLLYSFQPGDSKLTLKLADIPPAQVAAWFNTKYRSPVETVGLAAWLASKDELVAANAKLAELMEDQRAEPIRADIKAWLAAKHGWPEGSEPDLVKTHDLRENADGRLLLPAAQAAERLKQLDKDAADMLKELRALQGGDVRSAAGARRNSPGIRLDVLKSRLERFPAAYAGTVTAEHKNTRKTLDELLAAVNADMGWIEIQGFKADRLGIEKDLAGCADAWMTILRADPRNPELISKVATAQYEAAGVRDNGIKSEKPERAIKSAELWEKMLEIYPLLLMARNYAGLNYMAAGRKDKAKAHFEEVLRRTEGRELAETEQKNREFAEARMKSLK